MLCAGLLRVSATHRSHLRLGLDGQVEFELCWQLILRVQPVREVDPADTAVGVNLDTQRLHVVGAVRAPGEVSQVELDLKGETLVRQDGRRLVQETGRRGVHSLVKFRQPLFAIQTSIASSVRNYSIETISLTPLLSFHLGYDTPFT